MGYADISTSIVESFVSIICNNYKRFKILFRAGSTSFRTVPVTNPVNTQDFSPYDDNYLRTAPGLYPDLLKPLYYGGKISFANDLLGFRINNKCVFIYL